MRPWPYLFCPLAVVTCGPPRPGPVPPPAVVPIAPGVVPAAPMPDLAALNAGRARAGAAPFRLDPALSLAAQVHCDDMASGRVPMGHAGFPERLYGSGYPRVAVSEGVFSMDGVGWAWWVDWLVRNPDEAHGRDFRDPGHVAVGIGYASGPAGSFGTLDYGSISR